MKYTDILLDLDDTLIDTAANTKVTVEEIYYDYGLDAHFSSFADFFTFYYTNVSRLWVMYNKGEISKDEIQQERFAVSLRHLPGMTEEHIRTINLDYIERIMTKGELIEGAIDILDYLKPRYRIHILSNGFTEMQYKKMDSAGIALSYFHNIILSDVVGVNKPHPDIFTFSLNEIQATADKVIMIGDNLQTDIIGAYNSGIDQIWFNPDNKPSPEIVPTYIVGRLEEIKRIL
ncbi:YjjG family noncanonical pyrimidine nucleotidase [Dysgonomonas sp. 511]|uniref:YjjG family noncanonical pyrimidine nucleotidase n=1 Tax=Dysgonomonas sp. 511 TaxID=2302930 RepID=UPI0013D24991|nr:YjjG family noncanonical pyrimidine nucleotidase [Dysgonomonas sp. 511]NDV79148.1 noncanonical pyrimidine nucleotidase, YjjG family [Dysgonomonas sp. 511]